MSKSRTLDTRKNLSPRQDDSRHGDKRINASRDAEIRANISMSSKSPIDFPVELVPEGMEYRFLRTATLGIPDEARIIQCMAKGWTKVPPERHPQHITEYQGLVLYERAREYCDLERKHYDDYNRKIMRNMPGTENYLGEPSIPGRNNSEVTYSSGRELPRGLDFAG